MKKRQRKKNIKKGIIALQNVVRQAVLCANAQNILAQAYRKTIYKDGGIIPDSQGLTGDVVTHNSITEIPIDIKRTITITIDGVERE